MEFNVGDDVELEYDSSAEIDAPGYVLPKAGAIAGIMMNHDRSMRIIAARVGGGRVSLIAGDGNIHELNLCDVAISEDGEHVSFGGVTVRSIDLLRSAKTIVRAGKLLNTHENNNKKSEKADT